MQEHVVLLPEHAGPLLRALRVQQGLSQRAFARQLGVSAPTLSVLEKDASVASLRRVMRVLSLLGMELVVRPREAGGDASEQVPW
ncbi:MAG: helix-turn-helix domain-containing protein [Pseudomarimonas sp.]